MIEPTSPAVLDEGRKMGNLEQFFERMDENDRRCYLRVRRLKEAVRTTRVLDALLDQLEVPGKGLRKLTDDAKFDAIERQIAHYSEMPTSLWRGCRGGDILAASIWRCSLSDKVVLRDMFSDVRKESDLLQPVATWLRQQSLEAHAEIPMGKKRTDVVGHRAPAWGGLRGRLLLAVELKNEVKEMERCIDQMSTYSDYAHRVYLACTPAMAAEYLDLHAESRGVKHWDAEVLDRKLQKLGFGLLLVEGNEVFEHHRPRDNDVLNRPGFPGGSKC